MEPVYGKLVMLLIHKKFGFGKTISPLMGLNLIDNGFLKSGSWIDIRDHPLLFLSRENIDKDYFGEKRNKYEVKTGKRQKDS
ncbi:unnamed protein product [Dovyalis caffra]|uniref:Uncharacterized protein n=1 Tax=Dovyalis caffra TaxID=77055 RepID=A0AAV1RNK9_9ROSI|nr:unnamed protein product [Dovyalis caffra]